MVEQDYLNIGIGNTESEKTALKPAKVKIVSVRVEDTSKAKKVVFECKHPDKEETINLSSVSYLENKEIKTVGTWLNLDKEGMLQKGSALTILLNHLQADTINQAIGKESDTELNDSGYLCFKAY